MLDILFNSYYSSNIILGTIFYVLAYVIMVILDIFTDYSDKYGILHDMKYEWWFIYLCNMLVVFFFLGTYEFVYTIVGFWKVMYYAVW